MNLKFKINLWKYFTIAIFKARNSVHFNGKSAKLLITCDNVFVRWAYDWAYNQARCKRRSHHGRYCFLQSAANCTIKSWRITIPLENEGDCLL